MLHRQELKSSQNKDLLLSLNGVKVMGDHSKKQQETTLRTNKDVNANLEPLGVAERRQGRKAFLPVQNVRRIVDCSRFY